MSRLKPSSISLAIAAVCLALPALVVPALAADIPGVSETELRQALEISGTNRPELESALDASRQDPFMLAAMRFVIGNLPAADLGIISAADLIENYALALAARSETQYGAHYDDATWAHWVLPPRVSQEPLSDWRPFFHGELRELVADSQTIEDAAVAVNYWCGERVGFKQTQRRDQGPLATLKSGYGRCEEMVIFYIDACRAVGIPARQAYCPYWAINDNNHAWVEVYGSDGRWHFTGGCEPKDTLDQAWFAKAVHNAPLIVSMCFGLPGEKRGDVLSIGDAPGARYCSLNSTSFYRQTGWLELYVPQARGGDEDGEPYEVVVHVFNFGALRRIAYVKLDENGYTMVELGPGTYVVTTSAPTQQPAIWATVHPDDTTGLTWDDAAAPPEEYLLQFPADPQ
jgi:hypothetical protein